MFTFGFTTEKNQTNKQTSKCIYSHKNNIKNTKSHISTQMYFTYNNLDEQINPDSINFCVPYFSLVWNLKETLSK